MNYKVLIARLVIVWILLSLFSFVFSLMWSFNGYDWKVFGIMLTVFVFMVGSFTAAVTVVLSAKDKT